MTIKRALISVSDKTGLLEFAKKLTKLKIEIVSTGGTARLLHEAGIAVTRVSEITGFPEILDGRVKTLHPRIHGGILADVHRDSHRDELLQHHIEPFQLVVINLYPFENTVNAHPDDDAAAIENIDIGGPCMVRAAAKNYENIGIVTEPADYSEIIDILEKNDGKLPDTIKKSLALKAFKRTAEYDSVIARYFEANLTTPAVNDHSLPDTVQITLRKHEDLRYGENPHQKAAIYREPIFIGNSIVSPTQHGGKPLSFNNILDMKAAWDMACEFTQPTAIIVKHQNPCGAASHGTDICKAYEAALACDPMSAFGGIVALNQPVDSEIARMLHKTKFLEVIVAPGYTDEALILMRKKKNRRIIELTLSEHINNGLDIRIMGNGALIQDEDRSCPNEDIDFRVVTDRTPSPDEWKDLHFGWKICRFVKSNAIVLVKNQTAFGVGAGQMSRIDSAWIASRKAGDRIRDGIMASDAFFPFSDGIEVAADTGITAVIQPGGSIRDEEVIEACNRLNIAMVFTGFRHFKH